MKNQYGFTLVELLITIAILGIVLGIGLPSFKALMIRSQLITYTNNMVSALQMARAEAIKTHSDISVIKNNTWQDGWFIDLNGDNSLNTNEIKFDALKSNYQIKPTFNDKITYGANGRASASSITFCPPEGYDQSFPKVNIANTGRIRTEYVKVCS